jgi:hypothetical protein
MNPRRRSRGMGGFSTRSILSGMVIPAAIGAGGGIALDVAWGYLAPKLPTTFQSGWGAALGQGATAVGLGWALSKAMPRQRHAIAAGVVGALVIVVYNAVKPTLATILPGGVAGLGAPGDYTAYRLPRVTYGRTVAPRRMGAYLPGAALPALPRKVGYIGPGSSIQNPAAAMRGNMGPGVGGVAGLDGYIPDSMG